MLIPVPLLTHEMLLLLMLSSSSSTIFIAIAVAVAAALRLSEREVRRYCMLRCSGNSLGIPTLTAMLGDMCVDMSFVHERNKKSRG